ncbi:uncharacterized protein LOC110982333 [Acanthaster planci]|uniref:Uncharacterized protein LOC110982333 n=1 Tax=Acanthaster planci TaxID=133434 RepID=A0A8B7YST8_ACAPL|nr:uncharacterized protein LOC110982333 [Acanthaster planci]
MAKFFGLLVIFALAINLKGIGAAAASPQESVQDQTPGYATTPPNGEFYCKFCMLCVTYVRNMTLDKDFMRAFVDNGRRICLLWSPAVFAKYCDDFAEEYPDITRAIVHDYLDPIRGCAWLCHGQEAGELHPNVLSNFAQKVGRASKKASWK